MPYTNNALEFARWACTEFPLDRDCCDICSSDVFVLVLVKTKYVCQDCRAIVARVDENGQVVQSD